MKKYLLILGLLLTAVFGFSQATVNWIGGASGDWSDGTQWDSGAEPAAGDLVVVDVSTQFIRIEGTQNNIPAQIKAVGENALTIDLDLSVGNGVDNQHGLQINDLSQINIGLDGGTPRTVTIQAPSTKDGVRFNNTSTNADKAKLNIRSGSILNITSGRDGISSSSSTNEAVIINNDGTLNISGTTSNGINIAETVFNNNGTLNISGFGADGIRIGKSDGTSVVAGKLNNNGTASIIVPAGASSGSRAIEAYVGTTTVGKFFNFNSLTIDEGGNSTQTIGLNGGELNNEPSSTFDIGDGRIRIENNGKFINEGLFLKASDSGSGIFVTATGGTATNRAFFKYGNTSGSTTLFSNQGGNANGVNLNEIQDAGGLMSIDLGNVSYSFSHDGSAYGTSDANGLLTLPIAGLTTSPDAILAIDAFSGVSLTITNANVDAYVGGLPIELVSFNAKLSDQSVMLYWQTASELNNDYVAIEHSADGISFREIGRVEGEGDFNTIRNYELEHKNPVDGYNYYRLHQVDFDGKTELSNIIQVQLKRNNKAVVLNVFPTIATDGIEINIDLTNFSEEKINVDIINMNGQVVKILQGNGGSNLLLSTDFFPEGMFFVRVNGVFPKTQIGRFIKK